MNYINVDTDEVISSKAYDKIPYEKRHRWSHTSTKPSHDIDDDGDIIPLLIAGSLFMNESFDDMKEDNSNDNSSNDDFGGGYFGGGGAGGDY